MKIKCEICNSSEFQKKNDKFECLNCGMLYTKEQITAKITQYEEEQERLRIKKIEEERKRIELEQERLRLEKLEQERIKQEKLLEQERIKQEKIQEEKRIKEEKKELRKQKFKDFKTNITNKVNNFKDKVISIYNKAKALFQKITSTKTFKITFNVLTYISVAVGVLFYSIFVLYLNIEFYKSLIDIFKGNYSHFNIYLICNIISSIIFFNMFYILLIVLLLLFFIMKKNKKIYLNIINNITIGYLVYFIWNRLYISFINIYSFGYFYSVRSDFVILFIIFIFTITPLLFLWYYYKINQKNTHNVNIVKRNNGFYSISGIVTYSFIFCLLLLQFISIIKNNYYILDIDISPYYENNFISFLLPSLRFSIFSLSVVLICIVNKVIELIKKKKTSFQGLILFILINILFNHFRGLFQGLFYNIYYSNINIDYSRNFFMLFKSLKNIYPPSYIIYNCIMGLLLISITVFNLVVYIKWLKSGLIYQKGANYENIEETNN